MKKLLPFLLGIFLLPIISLITIGYLHRNSVQPYAQITRQFPSEEFVLYSRPNQEFPIDNEKPTYASTEIIIKPKVWAKPFLKREEKVYSDEVFKECKQYIETYDQEHNYKSLHLICGVNPQEKYILANGFGSSILYNALPVLKTLLKQNDGQVEIYLLDLPFQGLNGLFENADGITGESILQTDDAFNAYALSFHQFFQHFQFRQPLNLVCLSSSCTSLLRVVLGKRSLKINQFVLVGPYTGLTATETKLQAIGHVLFSPWINLGATGKFESTKFAYPFAVTYQMSETDRLKTLRNLNAGFFQRENEFKYSEFELIEKTDAYPLTSQIDNPPTAWTRSAERAYIRLSKTLKTFDGRTFPIEIYLGKDDKTVNVSDVQDLNEIMQKHGFNSTLKFVNGPHNLYTGGSFPLN